MNRRESQAHYPPPSHLFAGYRSRRARSGDDRREECRQFDLYGVETDPVALFAESSSRFLMEIVPGDAPAFEKVMTEHVRARLGGVAEDGALRVRGLHGEAAIKCGVDELRRAWQGTEVA